MPPRKKPEGTPEPLKAHIQGRLHSDNNDGGREKEALEFYYGNEIKGKRWDDRKIITEALLALRVAMEAGYQPPEVQAAVLTDEMKEIAREARRALKLVRKHVEMLNSLDLSSLRTQPGWKEDVWEEATLAVSPGASRIMGAAKSYDDGDDDD